MDSESPSTATEDENPQITTEADSSAPSDNPTSNQIDRDFLKEKPPPPETEDDESIDESRDTTSRTSTRLVKFQLFETKAVIPKLYLC